MKKVIIKINIPAAIMIVAIAAIFSGCSNTGINSTLLQARIDSLQNVLKMYTDEKALTEMRLVRFDSLDLVFLNNRDWKNFSISHADDIKAYYPDGSTTIGLFPQHIDKVKPLFVFAPDTKVIRHSVRFGSGEWTCVIGEGAGTFSVPMSIGNGKTIPPTNKKFKLSVATIGHWKDGKMVEEYLFWDDLSLMKQIGLAQ